MDADDVLLTPRSAVSQEEITADRLAAFSDAVFVVIVTVMIPELKAPGQSAFRALWPLWPTAISLCGELPVHRHYLNQPPLLDAVRRRSDAEIDLDQLRPSLHGVVPTHCGRLDCAHPARFVPCSVLCGAVRVHRHCLQRLRARIVDPPGRRRCFRAHAAHGEAPIPHCVWRASPPLCWLRLSRRASASV